MSEIDKKKGLNVLAEVITTVDAIGQDETIIALINARVSNDKPLENKLHSKINDIIAAEFKLLKIYIQVKSFSKTDDRALAVAFSVYFYKRYLNWKVKQSQNYFDKDRTTIWKYTNMINKLDSNNVMDRKILIRLNRVEELIIESITELTKQQQNGNK